MWTKIKYIFMRIIGNLKFKHKRRGLDSLSHFTSQKYQGYYKSEVSTFEYIKIITLRVRRPKKVILCDHLTICI